MPRNLRLALLSAIPVAVLLLPVFVYALDRAASDGEISRNITAEGIDLSGLDETQAIEVIRSYESSLAQNPLLYVIGDEEFSLRPEAIGLDIDEASVVETALEQRKAGFVGGFFEWLGSFSDDIALEIPVAYDADVLDEILGTWELEAIDDPAFHGGIVIDDGRALPQYPRAGRGIERDTAQRLTRAAVQGQERVPLQIPTRELTPRLTPRDIDEAVEETNLLIQSDVTLSTTDPDFAFTLTADQLADAFMVEVTTNSPTAIELGFDRGAIAALVTPYRADLETEPRDALFEVVSREVIYTPGRSETVVDIDLVLEAIDRAARSGSGEAELELAEGREADFTNEEAEAMLPMERVSSFTTNHASGQPRVGNIHTMADAVDNAIVMPGEVFSLNGHVGQRTRAKGYVEAPMIEAGRLVDSVGGGVSQFATTIYNAVFYGCYEDVEHKPHSFYISRYPEVNEATVSWPTPDLKFRNDSDALIIIKTGYTGSSITVSFYGNSGGRECTRSLGNRSGFVQGRDEFVANAALNPGQQRTIEGAITGFFNSVVRVMTLSDGTVVNEGWDWRYRARDRLIEVHPCMMPGAEEECPLPVPDVVGKKRKAAADALRAAGFKVSIGNPISVEDKSDDNRVLSQSVAGGEYLPDGSTITIRLGEFTPPEE